MDLISIYNGVNIYMSYIKVDLEDLESAIDTCRDKFYPHFKTRTKFVSFLLRLGFHEALTLASKQGALDIFAAELNTPPLGKSRDTAD
jgi:hypothetical protein